MILTFWSPGRSGATTLAAACAVTMATGLPSDHRRRRPRDVGASPPPLRVHAADLNRTAPSLGIHLGLFPPHHPADHCLSRLLPALAGGGLDADGLARHLLSVPGVGHLRALAGCHDPWAAARLQEEQVRHLIRLLQAGADVVVLDAGPQLDCPAAFAALHLADRIVLVAGPTPPERLHTRRYLLALAELGLGERVAVVANRTAKAGWWRLPRPGATAGPFHLAAELATPVLGAVPELTDLPGLLESGSIACLAAAGSTGAQFRTAVQALGAKLQAR